VTKKSKPSFQELARLRGALAEWAMRFHYGTTLSANSLAKMKQNFAREFGWRELARVVKEVDVAVALETQVLVEERRREWEKERARRKAHSSVNKGNIVHLVQRPKPARAGRQKEAHGGNFYPLAVFR